jgi:hypothetical protein
MWLHGCIQPTPGDRNQCVILLFTMF